MASAMLTAPVRALGATLIADPDDAEAQIAVLAVHLALWRDARPADPAVSASAMEALHVVLAAAYDLAGGCVPRHDETGYDHEPTLAAAARLVT